MSLVRLALIIAVLPLAVFSKDIRLRNEVIRTPDFATAAVAPQANDTGVDGLFLVQFKNPITDPQREELLRLNVELVQPVPEDAFVARVNGAKLSAIRALRYVQWIGPMRSEHKIHQKLAGLKEKRSISFLVAPNARVGEVALLRKRFPGAASGKTTSAGTVLRAVVDGNQLNALAQSPAVLWIEPSAKPKLFDEMASEIVGGELEAKGSYVNDLGFTGKGVVVSVADSGLMDGSLLGMHPDLAGRVDAFFHYGTLQDAADEHSHGTHVSGIVAGNGATGEADEFGLLYGVGVAPEAHLIAQRIFDGVGGYEPPQSSEQLTRDAVQAGAVIGSNSWGDDTHGQYDLSAMEFDALVRDADAQTPGDQQYILEFSAGNAGPGEQTIGSPAVAKNVIATGASQNNRFDFVIYAEGQDAMADFSSRGPCEDGRIKPDVVAPGTWIASLQSSSATDENAWLGISPNYQYQGGTSQAGPHASGAAAVFVQYYRETHNGKTPSPALVKAALINSAVDMDAEFGTGPIPNNDEGWGRIDLTELIGSDHNFDFLDQTELLAQNQVYEKQIYVADDTQPLRFTLVYTDVPGTPLTIPALVNDLDIEVVGPDGATYAGNQMLDGESAPEPAARDAINNVECVYLNHPVAGEYTVRVRAKRIATDARRDTPATDQDFAIVISGGLPDVGHAVLAFDRRAYSAPSTIGLKLIDFDLRGQTEAFVQIRSASQSAAMPVRLVRSGIVGVFTGFVATATSPTPNQLFINHGDTITATYQDTSPLETVEATRRADLRPPLITAVSSTNRFANQLVTWTTDEPANSIVRYGTSGRLDFAITNFVFKQSHSVSLTNLVADQTYNYIVISADEAGNASTNNNNGLQYTFVAQPASTVLLVDAYTHGPNDESTPIPVTSYTDALDATGVSYEVWNVASDGEPKLSNLLPFRVVIWRFNDSFYDSTSLSAAQQTMIENYLKADGSFLLASMEILTRLGNPSFKTNILGVAEFTVPTDPFADCPECDQDHGMPILEGLPGDSIGAGVEVAMNYDEYPVFELEPIFPNIGPDLSDTFTATTNAVPIFIDQMTGRTTGVRLPRSPKQPGRVVFLSFPLDGIPMTGPVPNNRVSILRHILAYLAPGVNGLGTLSFDRPAYTIPDRVVLEVADSDLAGKGKASAHLSSDTDATGLTVTLSETPRKGVFEGAVTLVASAAAKSGELRVKDGDTIYAQYLDGSTRVEVSAEVDARKPIISGSAADVDYEYAVISWHTDEAADSLVQFGESAFLGKTAYRSAEAFEHQLVLDALQPDHVYFYQIVSRDNAGNTVVDDNAGKLYTFRTRAPKMVPWSDDLEGPTSDWTVENTEDSEFQWERGVPSNGLQTAAHSGTKVWASNLRGSAGTYTETALISPAFLLTGGNRATLTFWHSYDFTVDATFESASLQVVTNSQTTPVTIAVYDGLSAAWEQEEIDLTPFIGKVVQLVWFYQLFDVEDAGQPHIGWMIDDVSISMTTENRGALVVQANLSQGTYTIEGPSPASAEGFGYTNSSALSGSYTVAFNPVAYYNTPAPQTKTLPPGGSITINGKYEISDVNTNGIADQWETQYFGSVSPSHSGNTDTDLDGASDYAEFAAGTSPTEPLSVLHFENTATLPDGRLQLAWPAVPGRSYRVLGSNDARTWTPYTEWTRSNATRLAQTLPPLTSGNALFFQVEVKP